MRVVAIAVIVCIVGCGNRPDLTPTPPDCGSYRVSVGASELLEYRGPQRCLLDAFESGEPATLRLRSSTVEGTPIEERYRVTDRRVVEVRIDRTADTQGVITERCTGLRADEALLIPTSCT